MVCSPKRILMNSITIFAAACGFAALATAAHAQSTSPAPAEDAAASSSLLATTPASAPPASTGGEIDPHALRAVSMFAIAPPEPRTYQEHDLVQIIVRETSQAK